jgi:hypothetical protein
MRLKLSNHDSRECYRRAEEARQKAEAASDPYLKADFLDSERRWLYLAHSYEFSERLSLIHKPRPATGK